MKNNPSRRKTTESSESIKLGIDTHAKSFCGAMQMDEATPEPQQQMTANDL